MLIEPFQNTRRAAIYIPYCDSWTHSHAQDRALFNRRPARSTGSGALSPCRWPRSALLDIDDERKSQAFTAGPVMETGRGQDQEEASLVRFPRRR